MSQDTETPITDTGAETATETESKKSSVSPGEMLKHARETLNLTISDLAGQTRLSKAVLEALEKNDFGNLAMPVYVRGYFRKCAHVMNMPEDKLLQAYADWTGTSLTPQPLPVTISEPPQEYDSPAGPPSWRYVLIIAVIAGAVLWWFGSGDEMTRQNPTEAGVPVTTLEIEPPIFEDAAPLPITPTITEPATQTTNVDMPALSTPSRSSKPMTAPVQNEASAEIATTPVTAAAPGPTTLQLIISQASWVSVTDDDDKRLIYGLLSPGTEQRVTGKPPYAVVLGHPQGVDLSIGGKRIDLAPYTANSGTARLEVEVP